MQAFIDSYPNSSGAAQFAPAFPDYVEDVVLAPSTPLSLPLPAHARFVVFSFDADVRVRLGAAGEVVRWPSGTSGNGGGTELNPNARRIPFPAAGQAAATHLHLVAQSPCVGSVSFYA